MPLVSISKGRRHDPRGPGARSSLTASPICPSALAQGLGLLAAKVVARDTKEDVEAHKGNGVECSAAHEARHSAGAFLVRSSLPRIPTPDAREFGLTVALRESLL